MKKILKEWKNFLKESKTGTGDRLLKFFRELKKTGITSQEYDQALAAQHIIGALKGQEKKESIFIKKNKKLTLTVLEELVELLHPDYPNFKMHDKAGEEYEKKTYPDNDSKYPRESKHFKVETTGSQKDEEGITSIILEFALFPAWSVRFDDSATLFEYAMTLREMVLDNDYGFDIFTPETELMGENPRGAGLGSIQTFPTQMPEEKQEEFLQSPVTKQWIKTSEAILASRIPGIGPRELRKHYEDLLAHGEASLDYYRKLLDLWLIYAGRSTKQHDLNMIENYQEAVIDSRLYVQRMKKILSKPVTREEQIDLLVKKAEQGDKQAAIEANKAARAYKKDLDKDGDEMYPDQREELLKLAQRMRLLAAGETDPARG